MKLNFAYLPAMNDQTVYLPFWRIRAEVEGLPLKSFADLVKLANIPKVVQEDWKERLFYFWAPAFKIRPKDFLKMSQNLTLSQPEGDWVPELPDAYIYPVTLPIMEAAESLKINLAGFMKPQQTLYPRLQEIEIKPKAFILLYIPFHERGNELSNVSYRLRINKNLLRFAKNL